MKVTHLRSLCVQQPHMWKKYHDRVNRREWGDPANQCHAKLQLCNLLKCAFAQSRPSVTVTARQLNLRGHILASSCPLCGRTTAVSDQSASYEELPAATGRGDRPAVRPITCQVSFESARPFPNHFRGRLPRWFGVIKPSLHQIYKGVHRGRPVATRQKDRSARK